MSDPCIICVAITGSQPTRTTIPPCRSRCRANREYAGGVRGKRFHRTLPVRDDEGEPTSDPETADAAPTLLGFGGNAWNADATERWKQEGTSCDDAAGNPEGLVAGS